MHISKPSLFLAMVLISSLPVPSSCGQTSTPLTLDQTITLSPTATSTLSPTATSTLSPTATSSPTNETEELITFPTLTPTKAQSEFPSLIPTWTPTEAQSEAPSKALTNFPTVTIITLSQTATSTLSPTATSSPTNETEELITFPTLTPTKAQSEFPSLIPTWTPTEAQSEAPSKAPTNFPTVASTSTKAPIITLSPTATVPSDLPSNARSISPSDVPSHAPSDLSSNVPSDIPLNVTSDLPSTAPVSAGCSSFNVWKCKKKEKCIWHTVIKTCTDKDELPTCSAAKRRWECTELKKINSKCVWSPQSKTCGEVKCSNYDNSWKCKKEAYCNWTWVTKSCYSEDEPPACNKATLKWRCNKLKEVNPKCDWSKAEMTCVEGNV